MYQLPNYLEFLKRKPYVYKRTEHANQNNQNSCDGYHDNHDMAEDESEESCFSVPKDVCYLNVDKQDKTGYGNQTVTARKSQDKANKIFPEISSNGLAAAAH